MPKRSTVQEGEVLKGFRVKLYPTQEQLRHLALVQRDLMAMWNVLVLSWDTHADHCMRHAEDNGIIGPVPHRPKSERDTNIPEEIAEWEEYHRLCRERRKAALQHCKTVEGLTRRDWANKAAGYHGVPLTEKAKSVSQLDDRVLRAAVPSETTTAHMVRALIKTYDHGFLPGRPPPSLKKRPRNMPLLLRAGKDLLQLEDHGTRTTASGAQRLTGSHRCVVKFGPLKIKGKFHRPPPGPFIEGISVRLEQDGWYASAKVRCAPQGQLPKPTKEFIAINPGLECIYADSDGRFIENPRGNAFSLQVRELSDWIDQAETQWDETYRRNQLGRYQERFARHVEDLIYSRVLPPLADYDTILIAKTGKGAAQGKPTRISRNDEGGYVSAMYLMQQLIVQRYGLYDPKDNPTGRVRVVDSFGISRRCSRCGTKHATRYQRDNSRVRDQQTDCQEPTCRLRLHVDVSAARNLLDNYRELQRAAE